MGTPSGLLGTFVALAFESLILLFPPSAVALGAISCIGMNVT